MVNTGRSAFAEAHRTFQYRVTDLWCVQINKNNLGGPGTPGCNTKCDKTIELYHQRVKPPHSGAGSEGADLGNLGNAWG